MDAAGSEMRRRHHAAESRGEAPPKVGQEPRTLRKGFAGFSVRNMKDCAHEERMPRLLPMMSPLQ